MTIEELKIRRLTNQYLIDRADKITVARELCGVQAQFFPNAVHSLRIRSNDFDEITFGNGLVKNWSVRGTVHVFAECDLPLFVRCNNGESYRKNEWGGYTFWNDGRGVWALTPERQKYFSDVIVSAVSEKPYTRDELKALCRSHGMNDEEEASMFEAWGGGIRELCERGFMHYVVQEKKAYVASPEFKPIPEEEAKLEIARRYFKNMGPATIHDAMYYTGAKQTEVKNWLKVLPVKEIECDGRTYYYIPNERAYNKDLPPCILLAGFDQLMLGYQKKESIFLPQEHLRGIFNLAGIVMPPILLYGRVLGKWKKKNKSLEFTLFESVTPDEKRIICNTAEEMFGEISRILFE